MPSSAPRRRKANFAASRVNYACLLYSLQLLFRANTKLKREAVVKVYLKRNPRRFLRFGFAFGRNDSNPRGEAAHHTLPCHAEQRAKMERAKPSVSK